MDVLQKVNEPVVATGLIELHDLTLNELAVDDEAALIVARFTRMESGESKPLRVAAFQSFIDVD